MDREMYNLETYILYDCIEKLQFIQYWDSIMYYNIEVVTRDVDVWTVELC